MPIPGHYDMLILSRDGKESSANSEQEKPVDVRVLKLTGRFIAHFAIREIFHRRHNGLDVFARRHGLVEKAAKSLPDS